MIDGAERFRVGFDVSRETMARCQAHLDLLTRWNRRINLVSRDSLAVAWDRHFADSAQLWRLRPPGARSWLDLGAGAGFPGLVIAAFAADEAPAMHVRLVESDQRKAAFLREAARALGVAVSVEAVRVEDLPPQGADVVSARALAPLTALLGMVEKHRRPGGIGLFPKGATVHKELADASLRWRFDHNIHASRTDEMAAVVEIGAIHRV
jgi:16S rRNA (guanine527-N7)-methyltransferase